MAYNHSAYAGKPGFGEEHPNKLFAKCNTFALLAADGLEVHYPSVKIRSYSQVALLPLTFVNTMFTEPMIDARLSFGMIFGRILLCRFRGHGIIGKVLEHHRKNTAGKGNDRFMEERARGKESNQLFSAEGRYQVKTTPQNPIRVDVMV